MKKKNEIFDYLKKHSDTIGWILLALLFIYMNVRIYTKLDQTMESDFASELVLAKLLASERKIITTSWFYSTELRVVNSNLVSMPLFLITDNWHVVRILTMAIMEIILFLGYYYLAKQLEIKHIPWIALMVVGATSNEYYKFVLLCSSYIPHIVIAFLSIGLLIGIFKHKTSKNRYIKLVVLLIIAYIGGLESTRLMSITYIPLVSSALIYCFIQELPLLKEGKFSFKDESVQLIIVSILGFIASFAGAFTNKFIFPKLGYSYKLDTEIISYTDINLSQLAETLSGWLKVFGYQSNNLEVLTPWQILIKPLFAVLFVLVCWSTIDILKNNKKYNKYEYFIALFMVVGASILTLLFTFTTAWYRNRYLLPISVFSIFTIAIFFSHYKINWQKWMFILLISFYVFANTHYQINYQIEHDAYPEFIEIKDTLLKSECYNGYCDDHWNGHNLLTELSDGKIETWRFDDCDLDHSSQWLQAKSHMAERPLGKTFLIIHKYNIESMNFNCDISKYACYEDDDRIVYIFDNDEQLRSFIS